MASATNKIALTDFIAKLEADLPVAYTARSLVADKIELWAISASGETLTTEISLNETVPSIAGDEARIEFWEREIHQMFGVVFSRPESNQSLYKADVEWALAKPLNSETLLARRNQTPWPGAKEPGVDNPVGKRRLLPPGVDPEVKTEDLI